MTKTFSEIDWSQVSSPLPTVLFDKYTHQSIASPIQSLGINETIWAECRTLAVNLAKQGFIDPISILYTSFKRYYSSNITIKSFTRWLLLTQAEFQINSLCYPIFQSSNELINVIKTFPIGNELHFKDSLINIEQIWIFIPISIRVPTTGYTLIPDIITLDNDATRLSLKHKRSTATRLHCLFALTPSGKYSNQLVICKPGKNCKVETTSTAFTRIVQTSDGDISYEHVQQWLDDFISLSYGTKNSALLIDPRTTLLTPDFQTSCEKSNIQLLTTDLNSYLTHILSPIFSLFDKQWSEANRLDKMHFKSVTNTQRMIQTIWFSLRTLKQNDQIFKLFNQTILWKKNDQEYIQSLQSPIQALLPKKKKKKTLVKTSSKTKLSSTMMTDPPVDSTPEQILLYILNRQLSISRASKYLGGMKLDYFKYCLSYKTDSSYMTGSRLVELNTFMQSKLTVDWLRHLRSLYFWSCAKQLFLREIYLLTGIITNKRSMNICGNNNNGSIRSCDQQSPAIFWRAFEEMHGIQLDNESIIDDKQWKEDFEQYLFDNNLDQEKTQLWTIDTFEFPLTKKSTILQLPEWNELRPMNLTPKVTVIYAFSNDGQSTEPYFIFPTSLHDKTITDDQNSYNNLGHLTPQIFLSWIEKYFIQKDHCPIALIFCSRLPILSSLVLSSLEQNKIYPFGYPYTRTLPFRYLFERRVRNNRSTNIMSELWKKTLLDQQRSHVLKGSNCTVKNIKHYFEQIWAMLINENQDDDDDDEQKTFKDKCQQAFQQANIDLKINSTENKIRKKNEKKNIESDQLVDQLNHLLVVINNLKEQINSTQVLKLKNEDPSIPSPSSSSTEPTDNIEPIYPPLSEPTTNAIEIINTSTILSTSDKRSCDENGEPHSSKRLRSSCLQSTNPPSTFQWIPPSKQLVTRFQSQSSSLFQFILSLVHTILTSSDNHLTNEQCYWLHSIVNHYDHNYNIDKLNLLIETACKVAKTDLVR